MQIQEVGRSARVRYRLTQQGLQKLKEGFISPTGERRKFSSVTELDNRTVSRIYRNEEPCDISSLMLLFRELKLKLLPEDYERAVSRRAANVASSQSSENETHLDLPMPSITPQSSPKETERNTTFTGEAVGGAELLLSSYYMHRNADCLLKTALQRQDGTILLKGPRHCGKSSLLSRGLEEARSLGCQTFCTDFDRLDGERLGSKDALYRAFANSLALQCHAKDPEEQWKTARSPAENLEYYLRDFLKQSERPVVWAMDGIDALVGCGFHEEVFAMLRGWHNARQYEPGGVWDRLVLILTYAAEGSLLISSDALSPFNVSHPILIGDFSPAELNELNRRYDNPLVSDAEKARLYSLCSGHPFLTRLALFEVRSGQSTLVDIEQAALRDGGFFLPYLGEIRQALQGDSEYRNLVAAVAANRPLMPSVETNRCFQRLRSAGVLKGDCAEQAEFRCDLYREHFVKYPL